METTQTFISDLTEKISMPDIYRNIRLLLDNPNTDINDFVTLLQPDSLLTASIIQFANSEFFGFDHKVADLSKAIGIIGFGELHDFVLGGLCIRAFCHNPGNGFNFNDFWRQEIKRGIAARTIARYCSLPASDRFFTIGLFLEIGHAAMYAQAPELASKALQQSHRHNQPIDLIEREYFGFDHCQLGSALLQHWHFPVIYQQIIENYLYPKRAKANLQNETDIANLAYHLCPPSVAPAHLESRLLIDHDQLMVRGLIAKEISAHLDEVYAMLNPYAA